MRNLAGPRRPVNRLWGRGFGGRLVRRIAHELSFPHERFALPQQSLSVLVHLRPQPHLVERAVEPHLVLGPLDEHDVAITWPTDAFVAYGFAGDLHWPDAAGFEGDRVSGRGTLTLQSMRLVGKSAGHASGLSHRLSRRPRGVVRARAADPADGHGTR